MDTTSRRLMFFLALANTGLVLLAIIGFHRLPIVSIGLLMLAGWNTYRFYKLTQKISRKK